MTPVEDTALSISQQMIRFRKPVGPYDREEIGAVVDEMLATLASLSPPEGARGRIVAELERRLAVTIGRASILSDPTGHRDWYVGERKEGRRFFRRYLQFLSQELGWSPSTTEAVDESTDTVMGLLEDPRREDRWDRRGLVVGHVQSGKTANYAGLIAKAADAGYLLIVVLAGMHNALRGQTQARLDRDFLGYDTARVRRDQQPAPLGVGAIDASCHAEYLTTKLSDFRRSIANVGTGVQQRPLLLVIKKNASILRNVNAWVQEILVPRGDAGRSPLLVVDDEADQASVDTGDPELDDAGVAPDDYDPTRINGEIRRLLGFFERSAYVGYTATPFANVLIHDAILARSFGEDLFPRSFIVSLPTPSNYVGPEVVFGLDVDQDGSAVDPLPLTVAVDQDAEGWIVPKHKKEYRPLYRGQPRIPPSLEAALKTFVVSCAARRARGQGSRHCSMLIHVSRFKDVHQRVFEQVDEWLTELKRKVRYGSGRDAVLADLKRLWREDIEPAAAEVRASELGGGLPATGWADIAGSLDGALEKIRPLVVNSVTPSGAFDYEAHEGTGLSVVAIGGDKLSRGLTLEGLAVSYFLRASGMYDSLMQMGRWFGYRPGYLDYCRLFLTPELMLWFRHVANATEELRGRLDTMARLGATPEQYGLRIQSHDILTVTAPNKMRHSREFQISFAGEGKIQTVFFEDAEPNRRNAGRIVAFLEAFGGPSAGDLDPSLDHRGQSVTRVWSGVGGEAVAALVGGLAFPEEARDLVPARLAAYVREQARVGELTDWTVAVMAGDGEPIRTGDWSFGTIERRQYAPKKPGRYTIKTILSPRDEMVDLSPEQRERALRKTNEKRAASGKGPKAQPDGREIRAVRGDDPRRALLLVYPLSPDYAGLHFDDVPVFGVVVSFPESRTARAISYRLNAVELRAWDE